jgi:hypothetical protein
MLVTLHGLSGGSHAVYRRHMLAPLVSEVGGWEACCREFGPPLSECLSKLVIITAKGFCLSGLGLSVAIDRTSQPPIHGRGKKDKELIFRVIESSRGQIF